jgi:hypothetical protein
MRGLFHRGWVGHRPGLAPATSSCYSLNAAHGVHINAYINVYIKRPGAGPGSQEYISSMDSTHNATTATTITATIIIVRDILYLPRIDSSPGMVT